MYVEKNHPVIQEFVEKNYLIPTDTIRQQGEEIVKQYISTMKDGKAVNAILVATTPVSRVGEVALVSDLIKENTPIFILDGHHWFNASLSPLAKDYPLKAVFINQEPDLNRLEVYYDYLDAYAYWKNYEG